MLLLRGNIGRPGAGVCPVRGHTNVQGDRTMGIYEKPPRAFLDALGGEFGFTPPARARPRHRRRDPRHARRPTPGVHRAWAATSSPPPPTPTVDRGGAAQLRGSRCRSRRSSTARTSCTGGARPDPARRSAAPSATCRRRRAARHGRGLDGRRARLARHARARARRTCSSEVAIVARLAPRLLGAAARRIPWDRVRATTTRDPRPHRPRRSPASRTSTTAWTTPAASRSPTRPATSAASPPPPARPAHRRHPSKYAAAARGPPAAADHALATTSTTPPSTASTTATAASRPAAASCWSTPTTSPRSASPTARRVDLVSEWTAASERRADRLPRRRLPDRPRLRGRLLPRDQPARPAGQHGGRQQHADLQVGGHPAGAGRLLVARQRRASRA